MALQVTGLPVGAEVLRIGIPVGMAVMVTVLLYFLRPPVTKNVMLSFTPWIVTGAAVHALFTIDAYPDWADPLFEPIAVYFTVFTAAGMVWAYMTTASDIGGEGFHDAQYVAAAGMGATLVAGGFVLSKGHGADLSRVLPAFGGLLLAFLVAGVAYVGANYVYSKMVIHTGVLGWLVVFGHSLDAVMTAIAADLFDLPPLYDAGAQLYDYAGTLPTAAYLPDGWLIVVVKVLLALVVVALLAGVSTLDVMDDRDAPVNVALTLLAAYGLGPGIHILLTLVVF
ncbi:hypothetical protein BRD00_10075 [Halobacteriales archaeon QS_8_69_26]|nr:MAG: hypothetical protein BRD00_10075 [Halobacteriales archaeon QS_8_69_26]